MKSLSLTTPRVLFLVGVPGAGKTHFAEKFSDTFGAPFIDKEEIRAYMSEAPSYSRNEQQKVDSLTDMFYGELLKTGKTFLYEGGLEARTTRTELAKTARKHGYEPMIIWVQTEPTTAKQRATKGVRGSKNILITPDRHAQLLRSFTPPNAAEKPVVISGKHTFASQAKIILKRLAEVRTTKADTSPVQVPERKVRKTGNITIN